MTEPEATYQRQAEEDGERRRDYAIESRRIADQAVTEGVNLRYVERARKALYEAAGDISRLVDALAVAERERDQARQALRQIAAIQPRTLAMIKSNGFVFDSIGSEPSNWQHLAFTIYTELCEAETIASAALAEADQ